MIKKIVLPLMAGVLLLAGCDGEKTSSANNSGIKGKEKLVWMEMVNNGSSDYVSYDIAYMDKDKQKHVRVKSTSVVEHILTNPETQPYVKVKNNKYHIYRQPMNVMYTKKISGKVKSKEVVSDEK